MTARRLAVTGCALLGTLAMSAWMSAYALPLDSSSADAGQLTVINGEPPNQPPPPPPAAEQLVEAVRRPTNAAPVARPTAQSDGPVRVGGNIRPPQKIYSVSPIYPQEAQAAGVQGVVIMEIIIDREGMVRDVKVVRSIPELDQAAADAVWQWMYTPTLLNGQPVEVIMTVTVNFTLT